MSGPGETTPETGTVRRIVTAHDAKARAIIVDETPLQGMEVAPGATVHSIWGTDHPPSFPDDGSEDAGGAFPPPGGTRVGMLTIAAGNNLSYHDFIAANLGPFADGDEPGFHRTPTQDFIYIVRGTVGLELDDAAEVHLHPGDVVVQNGTRHRWHNRGSDDVVLFSVVLGAQHDIDGAKAVDLSVRVDSADSQ